MATLKSTIQLYDGMSPALRSMNKTLGIVLSTFESLKNASGNAIDTAYHTSGERGICKNRSNLKWR